MSEVKKEFKDFIETLSKEICKEVLLEDLKSIKESLDMTVSKYESVYKKNEKCNKSLEKGIAQLTNTDEKLESAIVKIDKQTERVVKATDFIENNNTQVLQKLLEKNDKLFLEYNKKVHLLNETERGVFIKMLKAAVEDRNSKFIEEIKKLIEISKIDNLLKEMSGIQQTLEQVQDKLDGNKDEETKIKRSIDNLLEDQKNNDCKQELSQLKSELNQMKEDVRNMAGKYELSMKKTNTQWMIQMSMNCILFLVIIALTFFIITA